MSALQIVGGGRMGEALVGGLLAAGWAQPADLTVVERIGSRRAELEDRFPGLRVGGDVGSSDAVVAVKPGDVAGVCAELAGAGVARVLSIAAGVSTAAIEAAASREGPPVRVVRAMPNTPALVG